MATEAKRQIDQRYIAKLKTDLPRFLRNSLKYKRFHARKAGVPFDLDQEWLQKQPLKCAISGMKFVIPPKGMGPLTPSFDRKDPSLGYTKANTQLVCLFLNMAKGNWPQDEIIALLKLAVRPRRPARAVRSRDS
jgi:hypothetical protein